MQQNVFWFTRRVQLHQAMQKRLLHCKHEAYSPERIGECLLYKSHFQRKKLVWPLERCTCKGMGHKQVSMRAV